MPLWRLTIQGHYQLHVTIQDWDGTTYYATYEYFKIGRPEKMYTLEALAHSGTASKKWMFVNVWLWHVIFNEQLMIKCNYDFFFNSLKRWIRGWGVKSHAQRDVFVLETSSIYENVPT